MSEELHQNSTLDGASVEPHGTVCEEDPTLPNHDIATNFCKVPPSTKKEIMCLGYPSYKNIFEGYCFLYSYDFDYGVSSWVSECLTRDQMNKKLLSRKYDSKNLFHEDEKIDLERRVTLSDYDGSGYEKGHLAAAANHAYNSQAYEKGHLAAAANHAYNSQAYESTFSLSNIAPMYEKVNRFLSKIEHQGRGLAIQYEKIYSITGTVFYINRNPTFLKGGSKVAIPDAFFKVLACEDKHDKVRIWSYFVKNVPDMDDKQNINTAWRSLPSINYETGLDILGDVDEARIIDDIYRSQIRSRRIGL